jgi:hypothetical protein
MIAELRLVQPLHTVRHDLNLVVAKIKVLRQARLRQVKKEGTRIIEIDLDDGRLVRAKMFIDASYEGPLIYMKEVILR